QSRWKESSEKAKARLAKSQRRTARCFWTELRQLCVRMARISIKIAALLLPSIAMAFTPPDEKTIRNAIGDLDGLPPVLQRAFTPDKNSFDAIPEPKPGDWLAVHNERGQTFERSEERRVGKTSRTSV